MEGLSGRRLSPVPSNLRAGAVDVRSDIYALGATLWFALTGRAPFSATTVEEMRISRTRTPLRVEQLIARKVPTALTALLRSCLAIDPAERPASARVLMEALESCLRNLGEAVNGASQGSQVNRTYCGRGAGGSGALCLPVLPAKYHSGGAK